MDETPPRSEQRRRAAVAVVVAVTIAGAVGLLVYAAHAVLLVFAGLLVGVMLDALARPVARLTRLRHGWALAVVVLLLTGLLVLAGWLVVPAVLRQGRQLAEKLPEALSSTSGRLLTGGGQEEERAPEEGQAPADGEEAARSGGPPSSAPTPGVAQNLDSNVLRRVARTLGATFTALANVLVIVIIGIYAAAEPDLYVGGALRLLPPRWRDRAAEALHESAHQLRRWMLGTLIAMSSAAVMTAAGLWLLGVPYALPLALLAGLLEIVPNFGPIVAALPAVLLAAVSGEVAWWKVVLLYAAIQTVQSYVVQPLTQERMVEVPPVLLMAALVLFGWLLGTLGLLLAVPMLVVTMVFVRLLYVRDVLGEPVTPQPAAG